jgi:hypothetical protein
VFVNAPSDVVIRQVAQNKRQQRFAQFIRAAERGTTRQLLTRAGFSQSEVAEFRSALLRLGLARERGKGARSGWELVGSAEDTLGRLRI